MNEAPSFQRQQRSVRYVTQTLVKQLKREHAASISRSFPIPRGLIYTLRQTKWKEGKMERFCTVPLQTSGEKSKFRTLLHGMNRHPPPPLQCSY